MDWTGILTAAATVVTALGGLELVKYLLGRKTAKKVDEANAFKVQRDTLMEDYKRLQEEVNKLNEKVNELYDKVHALEGERLNLIRENNELRLALKEAEKKTCLQPDDRCLRRINPDDKCRLRKLLRGEYLKDHPDAILTDEDMMKKEMEDGDKS